MSKKNENKISSGLVWTFGERIIAQIVSTIVTIILARILTPDDYGIISIVTVFISICNIFVTSGFGNSVVRKKEATDLDFNTAFFTSLIISLILYLLIFVLAPHIAKFYDMMSLTLIMRIMGLRIPLASLNSIQHAHIQRQMKFKKFFWATLIGTIISAMIGISLAYSCAGMWALVAQYMTNTIIDTIVLQIVGDWHFKFQFSKEKAKEIFSFGWKVLVTDLVSTLENDIRSLVVGKCFGSANLAFYDQGKKYPSLLVTNINSSINKVMLPAYSKQQDDSEQLKIMLRKSIQLGLYILSPILIGFAFISNDFVKLVLTEKWLPCVPYVQLFCISYLTRPLESSCHQMLLAIGQSGVVLKVMLIINIFSLTTMCIAVFIFNSVFGVAVGSMLASIISLICFMTKTRKYIPYSIKEQLSDIIPPIFCCLLMGVFIHLFANAFELSIGISLIIKILIGMIIYLFSTFLLKVKGTEILKDKLLHIRR